MTKDRTAPFQEIRPTPLSSVNAHQAQNIVHTVEIPGLTKKDGTPLTVDVTFTLDEIDHDWVSAVRDYEFGDGPVVFGAHPFAVGPLREILPDAYPLPEFPQHPRTARDKIVSVMVQHNLGGWVVIGMSGTLEYRFPQRQNGLNENPEYMRRRYFGILREYLPFQADIWMDEDRDVITIRRPRSSERKAPVVRFTA